MFNKSVEELVAEYGEENVKVIDGEVHVYGQMPNSSVVGWYLYNYVVYLD